MDLDHRFRPSSGTGGRIILLGDGTEIETDGADNGIMFATDDEEKDLDSQVDKFGKDENAKREGTPGPVEVVESPSSVATEKSVDKDTTSKLDTPASDK